MSDCILNACDFSGSDTKNDTIHHELQRQITDLLNTTTAKLLAFEGKLSEMCVHIKDNLSPTLMCLLYDMKHSGELDVIITEAVESSINQLQNKTAHYITPQMFGASGTGLCDDTQAFVDAIKTMQYKGISTLHIPAGTYLVSEDIQLVCDITLQGDGHNSIIKRKANNLKNYNILSGVGVHNVTIDNLHIQGERDEHLTSSGEWGMCIGLYDCENITISRCKLSEGWGDGVYVGCPESGGVGCKNITIENCIIDHNRRNGVSVIQCDGFKLLGSTITNTDGTAPKAGIDFEANNADQLIKNCIVDNCIFSGNLIDVSFYDRNAADVAIQNCHMNSKYGFLYDSAIPEQKADGGVLVQNCCFHNEANCYLSNRKHINSVPVRFVGCVLSADTVAVQIGGGSVAYAYKMGDIHFVDCYIVKSPHNTGWIRYQNAADYPIEDVTLAVRLGPDVLAHNLYAENSHCIVSADIKCDPKIYDGSALLIDKKNTEPLICLDTRNNSCTVTLGYSIPYGMPITIRKLYGGNKITIVNEGDTFGQFDYKNTFSFTKRFDEVTIVHEEMGVWRVIDNTMNGVTA